MDTLIRRPIIFQHAPRAFGRQPQRNFLVATFRAAKDWSKIIMQCAVVRTKLFSKHWQVQTRAMIADTAVSINPVLLPDADADCPVRTTYHGLPPLTRGDSYNENGTKTNHIFQRIGASYDKC